VGYSIPHIVTIPVLLFSVLAVHGADLDVPLKKIEGKEPGDMMRRYLLRQVDHFAEQWRADYEKRKTPDEIAAYQKRMRQCCLEAIGGLPARTPLEPQIAGTISRPGYRVEKVLFQSQPKHYVTALLFLPDPTCFKPPYPGVIVPCGHTLAAKGWPNYQSMGALLALNGMVGLVFDPIDQGERGQYLGPNGWPKLACCEGHTMVGMGCVLLGQNTARFEIWDGMRAIDYLQSRPEVDPRRIGCTGNSGGGTQTSYLMAMDDRVSAAAPSCYITTVPKLLATFGAPDSEQIFFGQLAFGADYTDWLMMRAPVPILICAATKDFVDIGGTWDAFRCAKRLYTRMGFAERVGILENDADHNYNQIQREGAARWMSRWLLGKDQPIAEPPIALLTEKEYQCTPGGQVMSLPGARSVYDLNEDCENELAKGRAAAWASGDWAALLAQVRRLAGIRQLSELPEPRIELFDTVVRAGYKIEKLVIEPEAGILLPALLFLSDQPKPDRIVLYVHEQGKAVDAGPGGPIEQQVRAGNTVLAVDLRGTGQTQASPGYVYRSADWQNASIAYLLGRSYVGMRAEDILVCARYASERVAGEREGRIRLIAVGNVGVPALHAAVLEPGLFQSVQISRSLISWSNVVHNRLSKELVGSLVHGALALYDLPNLATALGDKLTVEQPVNAMGTVVRELN
jgi:dienelactone hydrolase